MAKRLGFGPCALIRSRPDPKQKWKLPVKYWIHELHLKRFGHVIGEKERDLTPPPPSPPITEAEMRRIEEQFYWEDYHERNSQPAPKPKRKAQPSATATTRPPAPSSTRRFDAPKLPACDFVDDDTCPF